MASAKEKCRDPGIDIGILGEDSTHKVAIHCKRKAEARISSNIPTAESVHMVINDMKYGNMIQGEIKEVNRQINLCYARVERCNSHKWGSARACTASNNAGCAVVAEDYGLSGGRYRRQAIPLPLFAFISPNFQRALASSRWCD